MGSKTTKGFANTKLSYSEREALLGNAENYRSWFTRLYGMAISCFEWINLPKSVDERFLEMTLFWNGRAVFFVDKELGLIALPVMAGGVLDEYAIPKLRNAFSYNGYMASNLTDINSVMVYNNTTRTADALTVSDYARRLANLDATIDININAQKTPILLACDESQRLTLKNTYEQYRGNAPVIFGEKTFDPNTIKVISTGAPYLADNLYQLKRLYYQEALTYLGIETNISEKTERVITGEITANYGMTEANRLTRLNARKQACGYLNEMFRDILDDEVDVRFRSYLPLSQIIENGGSVHVFDAQTQTAGDDNE